MSHSFPDDAADPFAPPSPVGQPPAGRSVWRWVLLAGAVALCVPFCCCGGLLLYSTTVKDFALSNGQHLGGSPLNVRVDYEIRNDRLPMHEAFFLVVRSADGTQRERNLFGRFPDRGTLDFHAIGGGQDKVRGPVQVWIEKEAFGRGGRSAASNTVTVRVKDE